MRFIADFHIHSHYSRATSKEMNIVSLTKWSQMKGINVVGTGDFTHPRWFEELREKLEPAEPGLYKLKKDYEDEIQKEVPPSCRSPMRFILSVEISTIYKKNDRVRKVHSLILAPSLEEAARVNAELQKIGNLKADGRPILGLDTKKLLQLVLDISEENFFFPAHIWTPHFSVFGSASGFDSLEECFEELTPRVTAIETGLSSDPAMNWRIGELDNLAIISNSDAHSAPKLGREANVFNTELGYKAITDAMRGKKKE
ncbi:MAG: endonuclease Q family protein, partial [Nanoarchaeota archaeon]|nr:endonuclease Q family protein [Nanoarchaeota archaeon]